MWTCYGFLFNGEVTRTLFLHLPRESRNQLIDPRIQLSALFRGSRDDQRSTRFVDEDRIDFVHNSVGEPPLYLVLESERQVIAEIVETKFVVGAERDIARIRFTLLLRGLRVS